MLMEDARERIVAFGKRIATEGLAVGTSGNLSEYDPVTGLMAISPSGLGTSRPLLRTLWCSDWMAA